MPQINHVKNIAIVGATGTVGTYMVAELLKLGKHEITAITRKSSSAASHLPQGVKVAEVDYDDESTLVAGLKGQDVLIITVGITAPPDTQSKLIRAAAIANVPFVLPNEWGCDMTDEALGNDILQGERERSTRKLIEELGKSSWIAVATGFWYDYSLGFGKGTYGMELKTRTWTFFDNGETKMNTTTLPQVGRAVAQLLSLPIEPEKEGAPILSTYKNKFVYVSSFHISQKDMFASVLRVTGTKESDWTIEYEESSKRFQDAQKRVLSGDMLAYSQFLYSRVFRDGSNDFEGKYGSVANDALGLPKEDLDEATRIGIDRAEEFQAKYK
ncbi:NAD(P)-binding protein [Daldinia caldariorum]|uniref:NAD(P)-binding protein n=1 Tax=Daldinia caldariorum TaxID=326644 RepID=UPI0020078378|nr:NAD(P)-binding protein [Daldinia caldariorum]KAI1471675.1 NAD(P)-binding protein [Daldinia caldariorum]